jgi:hypothetical protein
MPEGAAFSDHVIGHYLLKKDSAPFIDGAASISDYIISVGRVTGV